MRSLATDTDVLIVGAGPPEPCAGAINLNFGITSGEQHSENTHANPHGAQRSRSAVNRAAEEFLHEWGHRG